MTKVNVEEGSVEEVAVEDMGEGSSEERSRISKFNGVNQISRLNNSSGSSSRLNNSEHLRNKTYNMGPVDKCIRHLLADNLKTIKLTINPREELAFVEAEEVIAEDVAAEEDQEVDIKEVLAMARQIQG
jgi:hypothetical protein